MNKVKASVIITVILAIIFGGVMTYFVVLDDGSETTPDEDDGPVSFEGDDAKLSNAPPGIVENSNGTLSIDSDELLNSHTEKIMNSSIETNRYRNGELKETIQKDNSMRILVKEYRAAEDVERFAADNDYTIIRKIADDRSTSYSAENVTFIPDKYTYESKITLLLDQLQVETFEELSTGNTQIELATNESSIQLASSFGFSEVTSAEAEMEITSEGVIKKVNSTIIGTVDGTRYVERESINITEKSDFRVSTPSWVSTAEEKTTLMKGTYDITKGWILLEHRGLSEIPEGTELDIRNSDGVVKTVTLPESVSKNDLVGLGLQEDGSWNITINEEPSRNTVRGSDEYTIIAHAPDGTEYFNLGL
mgnify:CR=1 FL=1